MNERRAVSLPLLFVYLGATLLIGLAIKQPCATGDWADGRQYERLCYSDLVPLYGTEQLFGDRLPYLDECESIPGQRCDEYPLGTMYAMRLAAWGADNVAQFFYANAVLLAAAAFVTLWALYRMAGKRALYFALAPTVAIYAFLNWDLLAVAATTAATLAFVMKRDVASGVLIGIGTATKLYPALLLVPFIADRMSKKDRRGAEQLITWSVVTWGLLNLPFIITARDSWSLFFRFNSERSPDFDSLWFIGCHRLVEDQPFCPHTDAVNILSALSFVALSGLVYWVASKNNPGFARWTFAGPLIVLFLLTNKVYSPQYSLWLIPWFPLAMPNFWLFVAFEIADIAVFVTRFSWFGELSGLGGASIDQFQLALVVRAAILIAILVVYARKPPAHDDAVTTQEVDQTA